MLVTLAWSLIALATVGAVLWTVVAIRVERVARSRPTIRSGLDLEANASESVSVIIPAHNEERVIDACAAALRAQRGVDLQIVFVLDRCTDRTLEILRAHAAEDDRVLLIENDSCPDDWAGKCNAARIGAEHATGEFLVFTDADCAMDPDLLRAAVARARANDLGLLSLLSTLTVKHGFERVAQPVATMSLMRLYPIESVNRDDSPRTFANGQFMLFRRATYEKVGGHAAVKDDLLEDLAFARRVREVGDRGAVYLADGMLMCSMYDSMDEFRLGWKRIFIEACRRRPSRLRKNGARLLVLGLALPSVQLACVAIGLPMIVGGSRVLAPLLLAAAFTGIAIQVTALLRVYEMAGSPASAIFGYPRGCWIIGRILLEGARDLVQRRPIPWAGRQYVLEPRD